MKRDPNNKATRLTKEMVTLITKLGNKNYSAGLRRALVAFATHLAPVELQSEAEAAIASYQDEDYEPAPIKKKAR